MIDSALIPPAFGIVGLVVAFIIFGLVKRYDEGADNIREIADEIHQGAMVFMRREYTMLAIFAGVLLNWPLLCVRCGYRFSFLRWCRSVGKRWMDWHVHRD